MRARRPLPRWFVVGLALWKKVDAIRVAALLAADLAEEGMAGGR